MKNIVYVSSAYKLLNDDQLLNILTAARKNNTERDVTGILLYSEGTFMQVLEGHADDVSYIFSKIAGDARHKNIITLVDDHIDNKTFADWSMGFSTLRADKLNDIIGYLQSTDNLNTQQATSPAVLMIKTFIDSNKLTISY